MGNMIGLSDKLSFAQNQIKDNLNMFLSDISESNSYSGEKVIPVCCMVKNSDKTFFSYLLNDKVERVYYDTILEDINEPDLHTTETTFELAAGYIIRRNEYFIMHYIKEKYGMRHCTKSSVIMVDHEVSLFVVFLFNQRNTFLKCTLKSFGDSWLEDGLFENSLSRYRNPEEIIFSAVSLAELNMISIHTVNQISSLNYEGEKCNSKIAFINNDNQNSHNIKFKLESDVRFRSDNAKNIRKLLQMTGSELFMFVDFNDERIANLKTKEIVGIGGTSDTEKSAEYWVNISGYLKWTIYQKGNIPILKFVDGRYMLPSKDDGDPIKTIIEKLREVSQYNNDLSMIVKEASKQQHGTTLIITDNAMHESKRFSQAKRGYYVTGSDNTPLDLSAQTNIIQNITAIDGAILMDFKGACYGIGCILDGHACVEGNPSRGARFNSAKNYIATKVLENKVKSGESQEQNKYVAIILSEDRYIDIFTTSDDYEFLDV